jgi:DHA1 family tetracycline resistance protein-like MFS transporter
LWSIPTIWFMIYTPLYMLAVGVTKMQVGWISSLFMLMQMIGTSLGGYLADKWGRKKTVLIFDAIGWLIPMILWIMAKNVWYFVIAASINGFVYIVIPSWNCLFIEDIAPKDRPSLFAILQIVFYGAGLFTPLGGLMVRKFDMIIAGRAMYAIGFIFACSAIILRWIYLKETEVERAVLSETRDNSWLEVLKDYKNSFLILMRSIPMRTLFLIQALLLFRDTIWNTYSSIYIADSAGLGLDKSLISLLPMVSSVVMIVMLLLIVPHLKGDILDLRRYIILSTFTMLVSTVVFLLSPAKTIYFILLSRVIWAFGFAIFYPTRETYWANVISNRNRAKTIAITSTLIFLSSVPAGPISGYLYSFLPKAPFILMGVLQLACILLILGMKDKGVAIESKN